MKSKVDELIELMSEQISESDLIAAEQLAKISAQIVVSRIERDMTQNEFAQFMGVSQGMVSKWESEDYNFTVEALSKICQKLNLDLEINLKKRNSKFLQKNARIENQWKFNLGETMTVLKNGVA